MKKGHKMGVAERRSISKGVRAYWKKQRMTESKKIKKELEHVEHRSVDERPLKYNPDQFKIKVINEPLEPNWKAIALELMKMYS